MTHVSPPGPAVLPPRPADEIAERLTHLPTGWQVLTGAGPDHLVVGPGGVFAVLCRHHPEVEVAVRGEAFLADGRPQFHLVDARRQSARLSQRLSGAAGFPVAVHGVVAISGARDVRIDPQPRDVTVVTRRTLTPYLHAQPATFDAATVATLVALAGRLAPGPAGAHVAAAPADPGA